MHECVAHLKTLATKANLLICQASSSKLSKPIHANISQLDIFFKSHQFLSKTAPIDFCIKSLQLIKCLASFAISLDRLRPLKSHLRQLFCSFNSKVELA